MSVFIKSNPSFRTGEELLIVKQVHLHPLAKGGIGADRRRLADHLLHEFLVHRLLLRLCLCIIIHCFRHSLLLYRLLLLIRQRLNLHNFENLFKSEFFPFGFQFGHFGKSGKLEAFGAFVRMLPVGIGDFGLRQVLG